ncbi:MAG TPA: hypothetical protein V6C78_24880 [Crinalium sp.]
MFNRIHRLLNRFFNKSRTINNEPLNKVSLIVIILIDIFILINVFTGLDDISRWHISPAEAYPCYSEWNDYQRNTAQSKDYEMVRSALPASIDYPRNLQQDYRQVEVDRLGTVSPVCLQYAQSKDKINTSANQTIVKTIDQKQTEIAKLEESNRTIRSQYDSTLLEQIAGQPRDQSINSVSAAQAKQKLEQNSKKIAALKTDISELKDQLLQKPESTTLITLLKDSSQFKAVKTGYERAAFWYPSLQLIFQAGFLLPLIFVATFIHNFAQRQRYGLMALMSWHLLVIFCIPLLIKVFQFLQVGVLFQWFFDIIQVLFGGLLFLVSYLYILLIPLIGFGIIKFFQNIVFNPRIQAANRFQKLSCMKCAKRIRRHDVYCPHCGYHQYVECQNCSQPTYKHLPYCKECGYSQNLSDFIR